MRQRLALIFGFAIVASTTMIGCGPAPATVSGEVTVDGKPVERGVITYSAADETKAQPATSELKNGKYEIKTVAGKKFVSISAFKIVEKRKESDAPNSEWVDVTEPFFTKSNLTFEVKPGANTKDWSLDSKDKDNSP
jgi:hypothetical protein